MLTQRKGRSMATGSDHHREKPTQQGASDKHNRTNPASSSSSSGRANTSGRPHATPQGGSSKPQQSLSEQLQSVIEHQSQQSSQSSQPQSQWAGSSQAGSSSNASSSHTSQPGQPSQTLPGAGTGGTGIGLSTAKSVADMCHGDITVSYLGSSMFQVAVHLPLAAA